MSLLFGINGYKRAQREIWRLVYGKKSLLSFLEALFYETYIQNHEVEFVINIKSKSDVAMAMKARAYYLLGKYDVCKDCLYKIKNITPEQRYLLADSYNQLSETEKAWEIYSSSELLKLPKTWLKLTNLVENKQRYYNLLKLADKHHENDNELLVLAAQRANAYLDAVNFFERKIKLKQLKQISNKEKIHKELSLRALSSIISVLNANGFQPFLVSGTLLGVIRDGDFIPYDNDLDIGLFGLENYEKIRKIVSSSGLFTVLPNRSRKTLRVRHINGTPIDIFFHWRSGGRVWHGGVKVDWWNTEFELTTSVFRGLPILIPKDTNKYLTENYGQWKQHSPSFDSAIDTPNAVIVNNFEMLIHCLRQEYFNRADSAKYANIIRNLKKEIRYESN